MTNELIVQKFSGVYDQLTKVEDYDILDEDKVEVDYFFYYKNMPAWKCDQQDLE